MERKTDIIDVEFTNFGNGELPFKLLTPKKEAMLTRVADMRAKGFSEKDICTRLSLTKLAYCRAVSEVSKRWVACQVRDTESMVATELAKIDAVEQEAWAGLRASQKALIKTRVEESESPGKEDEDGNLLPPVKTLRKSKARNRRDGDPRWLDLVLRCSDRRCALLGLDAPKKHAFTSPDGKEPYALKMEILQGYTPEQLQMFREVAKQQALPAPRSS